MQITKTVYNPELLDRWQNDVLSEGAIGEVLAEHLRGFDGMFQNVTQVRHFGVYVKGLLSNLERKSMEPIALTWLGENGVRSLQQFMTRCKFADEKVLMAYQKKLSESIDSPQGMLSVDGSDFVKKGKHSVGVKRQYCGRLGKVESCQAGVFAAYAGENGYGIVDRQLYIPQEWFDAEHAELRKQCQVPEEQVFQTKNEIALSMIQKICTQADFSIGWIGCDAAFGCDHDFVDALPTTAHYFVATNKKERVFLADTDTPISVQSLPDDPHFPAQSVGFETSKGITRAKVKAIRCFSCRTNDQTIPCKATPIWLYIRRYENGDTKYFLSNAPDTTPLATLHQVATLRWPIEQCFEECKSNLGMADFEGRSYKGFLRHLLFVMIAHFFATNLRLALKKKTSP